MIDYALKDLLLRSDTDKQLRIRSDIGNITNADLEGGTFTLNESLCDDDYLRFGACVPSSISFTVHNTVLPLINKKLTLDLMLNGKSTERLDIGEYFVTADTPTADRKKRNVTAYDALYKVVNTDVADWYNSFFPNTNTRKTVKQLRDSFFAYFGIAQKEQTLVNDSIVVSKTIQPEELSGKVVAEAICEINGCFGHIGRDGKMEYIYLNPSIEGLYPSNDLYPSDNLFPKAANAELISKQTYIPPCEYETFLVRGITGVQIRKEENDVGATVGTTENVYVIQNNFLVYGKSSDELNTIGNNILSKIRGLEYRPFRVKAKGNPCLEVGDAVRLNTSEQKIESYIMQRTIKGVQQMFDEYTAKGREYLPKQLNGTKAQLKELQGKTNTLTRTVDETRSELKNSAEGLHSEIVQTAEKFESDLSNTTSGLHSEIVQTAGEIRQEVADSAEGLQAQIDLQAKQIQLRITEGEAKSLINLAIDGIELTADQISLEGYTTINGNFSIDENGTAIFKSESSTMTVEGGYVKMNGPQGTLIFAGPWIRFKPLDEVSKNFIRIDTTGKIRVGDGSLPTYIDGSSVSIKGYSPITEENIDSYVPDVSGLLDRIQSLENQLANLTVPTNSNQIDGDFRTGDNGSYMAMKNSTGNQYLATTEWVVNYVTNKLG